MEDANWRILEKEERSRGRNSREPPGWRGLEREGWMDWMAARVLDLSRQARMTRAPDIAKDLAVSRPMPVLDPVTMIVLPCREFPGTKMYPPEAI